MSVSSQWVVFLGPTLDRSTARSILTADYRPPAKMGDCYALLSHKPKGVLLIDGLLGEERTVWHREILSLLDCGIAVYGCSALGAVRAAELAGFGMRGSGVVFEWYRDGVVNADDAIAFRHADAADGYRALSVPLVNIRETLGRAVADRSLSDDEAQVLLRHAISLHHSGRTCSGLLTSEVAASWPADRLIAVNEYLGTRFVNIMREDAISLLRAIATMPATAISRHKRRSDTYRRVEYECRRLTPLSIELEASRAALSRRWFVREWAIERGIQCPESHLNAVRCQILEASIVESIDDIARCTSLTNQEVDDWIRDTALISWLLLRAREDSPAPTQRSPWEPPQSEADIAAADAYVVDWARARGVASAVDNGVAVASAAFGDWIVQRGPGHFGYANVDLSADLAVLREFNKVRR